MFLPKMVIIRCIKSSSYKELLSLRLLLLFQLQGNLDIAESPASVLAAIAACHQKARKDSGALCLPF
jgi:hypothetical protein